MKQNKKNAIFYCCALLLGLMGCPVSALESDAEQPINIDSNTATYDDATATSTYTGNDGTYIFSALDPSTPSVFSAEALSSNLSLDAYLQKDVADAVFGQPGKITFAGQPAYEGIGQGIMNYYGIIFKYGENIYKITLFTGGKDTVAESKAAFTANQKLILSSFSLSS